MQDRSDKQLIADYLRGDKQSFDILISHYIKPVYSFAYRYAADSKDAEDITQEAFVKAWRHIRRFDQNRSFKTWIFSITKNACLDLFKKKKSIPFSQFDSEEEGNVLAETLVDPLPLIQEFLERKDLAQRLSSALDRLSPAYRMILFLRYNDHQTFREISESLEEPLHTVKSRHRRALIKLREFLSS